MCKAKQMRGMFILFSYYFEHERNEKNLRQGGIYLHV